MNAANVTPVDLAMHMCLNRHPPFGQRLGMSTLRSHRGLTRSHTFDSHQPRANQSLESPASPVSPVSCTSLCGTLKKKKRVIFADAKGLALTAVRIFNSDPPVSEVEEICPSVKVDSLAQRKNLRVRLGFPQPSADLPSFLKSLAKCLVHLESCSLKNGWLFGKVRVCNISPEKAVHVRMTYDSWRSHQDIPCSPIESKMGSFETELFVFKIPVPSCLDVRERLEFCVSFRPGSGKVLLWDSNGGQNYRILVDDLNKASSADKGSRPQNSQVGNPQTLHPRNEPALYKSARFSSHNIGKTLSRQDNSIMKSTFRTLLKVTN